MALESQTVDKDEIERFSRIAEEWWDEKGKFRPLHQMNPVRVRYVRDQICAHFGRDAQKPAPLAHLTLLDIGCGGGLLCEPLTRLGAEVTGIDAAEKNIRIASLHAEKMNLRIDYQNMAAEMLVTQSKKFDIVLALEIIEHVADVPAFLSACASLLKPGGIIFVSTLNRTLKSFGMAIVGAEYVLRWLPRGTHQWQKFLKPSEVCTGLDKEGMQITHMTGMRFNPLRGEWKTDDTDLDVNYMVTAVKPAA